MRVAPFDLEEMVDREVLSGRAGEQLLVGPGDEEDVSDLSVLDGRPGKEPVREGEVDGGEAELVARPVGGSAGEQSVGCRAIRLRQHEPADRRLAVTHGGVSRTRPG